VHTLIFNEYTIEYETYPCEPTAWNSDTFEYCVESVVYTSDGVDAWGNVTKTELDFIEREIKKAYNSLSAISNSWYYH
jgi:hypothetical protein